MAVTFVEAWSEYGNYFTDDGNRRAGAASALVLRTGFASAGVPGDLAVVVIGSSKQIASYSSGWEQISNTGAGSSWVAAYRRVIAGGTPGPGGPDDLAVTWQATSVSWSAAFAALRSPTGFDATAIKSNAQNAATNAGASYALAGAIGTTVSGELSIAMGGAHNTTGYANNSCGVSGTAWTLQDGGGWMGIPTAICEMVASCATVGTPAQPSVTYNLTGQSMNKFIFGAVIREAPAQPPAGGGLFWG